MSKTYPYTIDNGNGEFITFTGRTQGPAGERVGVDGVAQPGAGPPMHVHFLQEEAVQVVRGRVGYQVPAGEPQFAGPGRDSLSPGPQALRTNGGTLVILRSADDRLGASAGNNIEFFLSALFASTKENGGKRPGLFHAAFLVTRYRTEFALLELPAFVTGVVMPMVYRLGVVLGKDQKFKDAPAPMQSNR